jgi:hypothetical protein
MQTRSQTICKIHEEYTNELQNEIKNYSENDFISYLNNGNNNVTLLPHDKENNTKIKNLFKNNILNKLYIEFLIENQYIDETKYKYNKYHSYIIKLYITIKNIKKTLSFTNTKKYELDANFVKYYIHYLDNYTSVLRNIIYKYVDYIYIIVNNI